MAKHDNPLDLYLAYYADADAARLDYDSLEGLASADVIKIDAIALVRRDADGKIDVVDNHHSGRKGAGVGAAVGLVVGAIFPPSLLGGAIAGGLVGGGTGSLVSRHRRKEIKADLESHMPPDSSAVVCVFEEIWAEQVEKALASAGALEKDQLDESSQKAITDAQDS